MPSEREGVTTPTVDAKELVIATIDEAKRVIAGKDAEIARYREALREAVGALNNFAGEAEFYDPDDGDSNENGMIAWCTDVTIGALRQARSAVAAIAPLLEETGGGQ